MSTNKPANKEPDIKLFREKDDSERITKLKKRTSRCVCKFCGHPLELRKITYAAYDEAKIDIYCNTCQKFENGVEPLIYKMATFFVDEIQFDYYPELNDSESKHRMNVAVVCDIITWGFQNAGMLGDDGFTIKINIDENTLGEASLFTASEIKESLKEC